jgi:hypothetical protein
MEKRRERIWDAQRTGLRNRLRDQWRLSEDRAEACLAAWETEAASRGLEKLSDGFWAAAEDWLTEEPGTFLPEADGALPRLRSRS